MTRATMGFAALVLVAAVLLAAPHTACGAEAAGGTPADPAVEQGFDLLGSLQELVRDAGQLRGKVGCSPDSVALLDVP
jgi:hypothetical protein